jgi:hypothetical protein
MMMIPMKKRRERNERDHQDIMIQIAAPIAIPTILREEVMIERKARRERNTNQKNLQRDDNDITFFIYLKMIIS